jgi:hypothetical protein
MTATGWKGIDPAILRDAGVTELDGRVRVPYRRTDGTEHNAKLFASSGRSWWEHAGRELIPFGLERLAPRAEARYRALLVAEGESDSLALRERFGQGADVLGVPGARTWRREWRSCLEGYALVYTLGDGDEAGRELNAKVKLDVPWSRSVWLPEGEDARSMLERDPAELDELLTQANENAHLEAALLLAQDVDTAETLLRGDEVPES